MGVRERSRQDPADHFLSYPALVRQPLWLVAYRCADAYGKDQEEWGILGSKALARELRQCRQNLPLMVRLEMLACTAEGQDYPIPAMRQVYGDRGDFIAVVGNARLARSMGRQLTTKVLTVPNQGRSLPTWPRPGDDSLPGGGSQSMKVVPLRLTPGDDLRRALEAWMGEQHEQAGCLISAVGSLSVAQLRLAGAAVATVIRGDLEILSLAGTLSPDGAHLHIAVAGSNGAVIGGHLGAGSLVRTTAELVVGLLPEWRFCRELDPVTGYGELQISPRTPG